MHGKFHRKALFDADLRKGTIKTPINSTHSDEKTHRGANHVQPTAHHAKAVVRGLGQGVTDP